jgi:hypothetical protein
MFRAVRAEHLIPEHRWNERSGRVLELAPMNRSIVYAGLLLLVSGIGLILLPFLTSGVERVDLEVEIGLFAFPAGIAVMLWGGASPDPELSTVRGFLGNPEENLLWRRETGYIPEGPARFRPSPRESVNCRFCYTSIPAQQLLCSRCGRRRECRNCQKPLFQLAGAVRCAPCVRDEAYCNCPSLRPRATSRGPMARRA